MEDSDLQMIFVENADTPKPPTNKKYPRLYGHQNCPFVEKARIALAAHNVKYQRCEMDLGKKKAISTLPSGTETIPGGSL